MNRTFRQIRKIRFYAGNALSTLVPDAFFRSRLPRILSAVTPDTRDELLECVDYYLGLDKPFALPDTAVSFREVPRGKHYNYYFDLRTVTRYLPADARFPYLFGDVRHVPQVPTLVKSRPIGEGNRNAVLMKLNQIRHFFFVKNDKPFTDKKDALVWRGKCFGRSHRREFLERFYVNPRCDVGDTATRPEDGPHRRRFLSVSRQLGYKFILSLEGNDVATNLKWILSSNSLCLMPRPRFETWFIEGRLEANRHYVMLEDDYSDLEEKMDHFLANPHEALAIIQNAQAHVARFKKTAQELLLCLLVMQKYLHLSGQESCWPDL